MNFDLDTAEQAMQIATNGTATLNSAVNALGKLKRLMKSSAPLAKEEAQQAITSLQEQLATARETNIELREYIGDLRNELLQLKYREDKFEGYELWETPVGGHVYRSASTDCPAHYLCPTCHDAGVKTILQGDKYRKVCNASPSHGGFDFERMPPLKPRTVRI